MTSPRYVPMDLSTAKLVLFSDDSFANSRNLRSQLGFVVALCDSHGTCNIIHYGSSRCKRVVRSVMAAEVQGLVLGFYFATIIQHTLTQVLGRKMELEAFVDSRTLFNVVSKDSSTTERRLQIYIEALRQSYEIGELARIGWVPGTDNPADGLTKCMRSQKSPLNRMMVTNKIAINPVGWADKTRLTSA